MLNSFTVDDMLAAHPCKDFPRERLVELWAGRERVTAIDVMNFPIQLSHRVWAALQIEPGIDIAPFKQFCEDRIPERYHRLLERYDICECLGLLVMCNKAAGIDSAQDAADFAALFRKALEEL